jgi:acyl-CoA synthetase (AMP-forming)/AMP-acid ligase II
VACPGARIREDLDNFGIELTNFDHIPTVGAWIHHLAEAGGEREMIVSADRRLTYSAAEHESNRLARGMLAAGIGKGTRLGLLLPNGPDWLLAWLAASRIGALVIPICTFYRARELRWTLRHADVQVLLTSDQLLGHDYVAQLEEAAPGLADQGGAPLYLAALPNLREIRVWGGSDRPWASPGHVGLEQLADEHPAIDGEFLEQAEACVTPADAAILVYTSGSTADPKGAVHTHGTLVRHAHAVNERRGLRSDDRLYTPMPFFWVGGFHTGVLACMAVGACLLCEESFDAGRTLALLERERATLVLGWPYHGKALAEDPSFAERDLSSLRAGARNALPPADLPPVDPELRPNWLGMTETFGPHCAGAMDSILPEHQRGSFGTPLPGSEHRVADPETGEILPPGTEGEICVRGGSLMQGLYKLEREEIFDREGFYHTGDGGYFGPDGHVFFTGRLGDTIKTAGANVTPREVELVLESFDEVKEAHVVGIPDPARGEIVVAAVVLAAERSAQPEDLRRRAKDALAAFKVPKHVFLCEKAELPETATGKIRKDRLRESLTERVASLG